jgi:hypothetical protein
VDRLGRAAAGRRGPGLHPAQGDPPHRRPSGGPSRRVGGSLGGGEPQPDHWHASATTTSADLAPFTAEDLDEARSRLVRLGRIWADRLEALSDAQLDRSPGDGWSFRLLAAHVAGSLDYYARAVGRLGSAAPSREQA